MSRLKNGFAVHTLESAPPAARPHLEASLKGFGMLPNLHALMAESPESLEAYKTLTTLFLASSFATVEKHVLWIAINVEHACHYCVPAHTAIALQQGVDPAIIEALRQASPLADAKLEALRAFALKMIRARGHVETSDVDEFFAAGFTRQNALEVVLAISHKILSNYVNHIAGAPTDAPFAQFEWTPPRGSA